MSKFLFSIFSFTCLFSFAQSNDQQVISSCGTSFFNDEYIMESTLGETVISTIENGNILTQGFHQANLKITSVSELTDIELKLYPNPTIGLFTLEFGKNQGLNIDLSSFNGKTIFSETIENQNKKTFDISQLTQGIYILKVTNTNNQQSVYKINKLR